MLLTIAQVADYAGLTVRAVRHYHQIGLLPEPRRDSSGYRRYGAQTIIELTRIRTLAEAGVPLARIAELLEAPAAEFELAMDEIDRDLRRQARELRARRVRLAALRQGDELYLPPSACAMLEELRALGVGERVVARERESWILMTALYPEHLETWIAHQRASLADPEFATLYRRTSEALDWALDDPRLDDLAVRTCDYIEASMPTIETWTWASDITSERLVTAYSRESSPIWALLADKVRAELVRRGHVDMADSIP